MLADGSEATLVPKEVVVVTVKVYGLPFVSPATVHLSGPEVQTQLWTPSEAVAVYSVIR
jgi:hypothetical protein